MIRGAPKTRVKRVDVGRLEELIEKVRPALQDKVALLAPHPREVAAAYVLLVMDGTSPLAEMAPGAIEAAGRDGIAVRLISRGEIARFLLGRGEAGAAELATTPLACGADHLGCMTTTGAGGSMVCAWCDLHLEPPYGEPPAVN